MEPENKEQEQKNQEIDQTELQLKIDKLNKQIEDQKLLDASKKSEDERRKKEEQEQRLKQEADIKKALQKEDVSIDDLTNSEILNIVGDAFEQAIDAKASLAIQASEEKLQSLQGELEKITKYLLSKEASEGVQRARSKYSDFDTYKDDISKIFEQYPSISPDDAYVLAKIRKAGNTPPRHEVETERPDNFGTRREPPVRRQEKREEDSETKNIRINSRRNLRDLINEGIEKTLSNRSSKGM